MSKILDLIFEDVKNENETKKTAVTLRISALIFIGYFLCLMAVFCSMGDWMNVGGCLVCGVCYVLSFYTTYWNHTRESAWISQILMIVWIILFIVMFGWDCGVQHYLFAFLALNFTVSTAGERRKVLTAVGAPSPPGPESFWSGRRRTAWCWTPATISPSHFWCATTLTISSWSISPS